MVKNEATIYPPKAPIRWPAPFFLIEWIVFLADLIRRLYQLWQRSRHEGMYEILEYDSVLELCDPKGKTAVFKRHQRVKFLQDDVIAFQDHAWGAPRGAVWIMSQPTPRERRVAQVSRTSSVPQRC